LKGAAPEEQHRERSDSHLGKASLMEEKRGEKTTEESDKQKEEDDKGRPETTKKEVSLLTPGGKITVQRSESSDSKGGIVEGRLRRKSLSKGGIFSFE